MEERKEGRWEGEGRQPASMGSVQVERGEGNEMRKGGGRNFQPARIPPAEGPVRARRDPRRPRRRPTHSFPCLQEATRGARASRRGRTCSTRWDSPSTTRRLRGRPAGAPCSCSALRLNRLQAGGLQT